MGGHIKLMKKAYTKAQKKYYPVHERFRVGAVLAFIGGFLESYTYLLKGGIFANAQTGNFALMAINFAYYKNPLKALYYLIPICAYIVGIFLTTSLPKRFDGKNGKLTWYNIFIIIQFFAFLIIGFLPPSSPYGITTVSVSFLCAMQYNTFKSCRGHAMSTVFCTNNLRQLALSVAENPKCGVKGLIRKGILYLLNILFFVFGAALGGAVIRVFADKGIRSEYAIWICCILLIPVAIYMMFNDKKQINNDN